MKTQRATHRYIVEFLDIDTNEAEKYNAGVKAPRDVVNFLQDDGWEVLHYPYIGLPPKKRFIRFPIYAIRLLTKLRRGNEFMMIHPYFTWQVTIAKFLCAMKCLFRISGVKMYCFAVDIMSTRFIKEEPTREIKVLNIFDGIIVHSPAMKEYVIEHGYKGKVAVLGLLDYGVTVPDKMERTLSHELCFAGNLTKSVFLHTLEASRFPKARFLLYGLGFTEDLEKPFITYKGKFSPEDLSSIEGSWGLIWDGDSCKALDGNLGSYMKINSPHKASMCICAGLPLIVPEGSFSADVVRKEGIGIVLENLEDVDTAIDKITPEGYGLMLDNVHRFAYRLTHGLQLSDALTTLSKT